MNFNCAQNFLFHRNILNRLNISHKDWNFYSNPRTETRGFFARDEHEIKRKSFPSLTQGKFKDMTCSQMLDYLLRKEHVDKVHNFATFETFQKHYLTPEGSRFYFDVFGYDGDLDGSPEGVVEFYEQLAALTGKEIRPLRGMSAFIEALAKSARGLGTKIFTGDNHKILSIDKQTNQFVLKTSQYEVSVGKLVVAAPPGAFGSVSGSVAEQIQRAPEFQSILPRPAFKGAAVYPTAWWEEITNVKDKLYPMERFLSNSDCLGWTLPHRWGLLTRYTCIFSSIYIKAPYRLRIISFLNRYNIITFFLFSKGLGFDSSWVPAL